MRKTGFFLGTGKQPSCGTDIMGLIKRERETLLCKRQLTTIIVLHAFCGAGRFSYVTISLSGNARSGTPWRITDYDQGAVDEISAIENHLQKCETTKKFLGANYDVMNATCPWFPKSQFGITLSTDFETQHITIRGKGRTACKASQAQKESR